MSNPALTHRLPVPFVDLDRLNEPIRAEFLEAVAGLLDSGAFVNGPAVGSFEHAFASYCQTADAVGVASGLDALRLALLAGGIEPGDEVIVPAQTFVATLEAVTQARGTPVPAEISSLDYNLDPEAAEAAVTSRTRFVLPVHLYGQMADMRSLRSLADEAGLAIVEDACQAHGAERDGLRAGAAGLAGAFSFYPAKNLGAMGDAGALTTDDADLAARVRALREHGQSRKYRHDLEGYTARLDTIQAIVLELKLRLLDGWNVERRAAARFLTEALADVGDLVLPEIAPGSTPVWHLYVVRTGDPEALAGFLRERGIATGRHYPEPVHLAPAYAHLGYSAGAFPVAEQVAREGLSLPMFPGISEVQLTAVADAIGAFFSRGK
jgi:dTDP-4-amino-4,6-dideoxygalactose transaminase